MKISDFDGKTFEIKTLDPIKEKNEQGEAPTVTVKSDESQLLPNVDYETEASLLKDVPLKGRPRFRYKALYKVTDNYLKVFQVGEKKDIDKDQQIYAETLPDGTLAVPLIGYPIKGFYTTEKVRNGSNQETRLLGEFQKNRDQATHFRFDPNSGELYEAMSKQNLFPAKYFEGEWYYSAVVTAARVDHSKPDDIIGLDLSDDQDNKRAGKVRIHLSENLFKAQNVNIDDRFDKKDDVHSATTLAIPVKWKDFESLPKGRDSGMQERESVSKAWSEKRFIELDFTQARTILDLNKPNAIAQGSKLVAVTSTDDFFSFVLQSHDHRLRIRYSFMKATKRTYQPRVYFKEDSRVFGFDSTLKAALKSRMNLTEEALQKNVFLKRFDPKISKIIFHLTTTSPEWLKSAAQKAISAWDQAFASAGSPIRIIFDSSQSVELGDIRFNAINFVANPSYSDSMGYGPTLSDPATGEIISATSNVYIEKIKADLELEVRNYVRFHLGLGGHGPGLGFTQAQEQINSIQKQSTIDNSKMILRGNSFRKDWSLHLSKRIAEKYQLSRSLELKATGKISENSGLAITSKNIHADIKKECPEIQNLLQELKGQEKISVSTEHASIESCSNKLLPPKVISVLIHELGHNFGLTHNFMGSADNANFWPKETTQTHEQVRSSSVMEYPTWDEDHFTMAGAYDIAALRFAYADSILLEDQSIKKVNPLKPISESLGGSKMRPFLYCSDYDKNALLKDSCLESDSGTSPLEIASNLIETYRTSLALWNYRYDAPRPSMPDKVLLLRFENLLTPLKRIYDEWRFHLWQFAQRDGKYLETFDDDSYAKLLKSMENDSRYGKIYAAYRPAAEKIYHFLKMIAFLPNRYCLIQKDKGNIELMELDWVRDQIFSTKNESVTSCSAPSVHQLFNAMGYKVIGQTGHFLEDLRYDKNPDKANDPFDVIGSYCDRWFAALVLTDHFSASDAHASRQFFPSFLDEPPFRKDWTETLENRILKGVNLAGILKNTDHHELSQKLPAGATSFNFASEKFLLVDLMELTIKGIRVPGDSASTWQRRGRYEGTITANPSNFISSQQAELFNGLWFVSVQDKEDHFTNQLIKEREKLHLSKSLLRISAKDLDIILQYLQTEFPKKEDLPKITMGRFLDLMEGLATLKVSDPKAVDVLSPYFANALFIKGKLEKAVDKASDPQKKELLGKNILAFYQEHKKPCNFHRDQYLNDIKGALENARKTYQERPQEFDAKLDLLNQIMMTIGNTVSRD